MDCPNRRSQPGFSGFYLRRTLVPAQICADFAPPTYLPVCFYVNLARWSEAANEISVCFLLNSPTEIDIFQWWSANYTSNAIRRFLRTRE